MNEELIKKEPNYFLGGSIIVAAIIFATGWIYSAQFEVRSNIPAGATASLTSHSAPDQSAPAQPAAPKSSGGCGV